MHNSLQHKNTIRYKVKYLIGLEEIYHVKRCMYRIQRSGSRWWSRTSRQRGSSPATEPSRSTPRRSGGWSPPTWRSHPPASPGRPLRKRSERSRRCDEGQRAASLPRKSHLCVSNLSFTVACPRPSTCSRNLSVTVVQRRPRQWILSEFLMGFYFHFQQLSTVTAFHLSSSDWTCRIKKKKSLWNNVFVFLISVTFANTQIYLIYGLVLWFVCEIKSYIDV